MMIERIVSYYARPASFSTGGVNTSRQQWMLAFARLGYPVEIVSARGGFEQELVRDERITYRSIGHFGRGRMTMVPRGLGKLLRRGDLVYLHEGWTVSNMVAAAICRARGVDYVVIPHGVYAPSIVSALRLGGLRRAVESRVLANARAVHLFFDSEVPELAAISPVARPVVAVTGLDVPDVEWSPDDVDPYLAWIGRYDIEHKGIDRLLVAVASLPESSRPVIRMQGPDHRGDKTRVEALVEELELEPWISVGGELSRAEVLPFLAASRGFVHVPRWEAFGRTIVEALSTGVPVLLGDGAHIAGQLDTAAAARIVASNSVESIAAGLRELWLGQLTTGPSGRAWVIENLSWPMTSRKLLNCIGEAAPKEARTNDG